MVGLFFEILGSIYITPLKVKRGLNLMLKVKRSIEGGLRNRIR